MCSAALVIFLLTGLVSGQSVSKSPSLTRSSSKSITQSIGATPSISATSTPLPQGPQQVKYTDFWKYSDSGIALDSTWYTNAYDDSQWQLGRTPAGKLIA
jgi:hypothetical protein